MVVPSGIALALGPLLPLLSSRGFSPTHIEQSAWFGDFTVRFARAGRSFAITRDRSQFIVHGAARSSLEAAGLWQAFGSAHELATPLGRWLEAQRLAEGRLEEVRLPAEVRRGGRVRRLGRRPTAQHSCCSRPIH